MEARRGRRPYPGLVTPAEDRVLKLLQRGLTNGEIAESLGLSVNTVKYHVANLLAKAQVGSREELQGWRMGGRWRAVALLAPPARVLATSALAAAAAVGAVMVLAAVLSRSPSERTDPPAVAAGSTPDVVQPKGPPLASDRVTAVDSIAVVAWDGPAPSVTVLDTKTGATPGQASTSYQPIATFRRSKDELLVSHLPAADESGRGHVVDVLDVRNGLALKRRIAVPDRPNYHAFPVAAQAISADERYFAIYSYTMRTELSECATGGDGPSCTRAKVRIIDLESSEPDQWLVELPRHCFGGLGAYGSDGFVATCGDTAQIIRRGSVSALGVGPSSRFETDPVTARNKANGMYWLSADDGWFGTLISQGSFVWTKDGEAEINFVASKKQPRWPIFAEIGGGRLVVGYVEHYYDQFPEGLSVFDMASGQIVGDLPGFDISRSMVAAGPDSLLATTQDGRVIRIDVPSGTATTLAVLADDAENVALVR